MVLAGIEARRLVPATVAGLLTPALLVVIAGRDDDFLDYKLLVGAGFLPAATTCLLASWAAASRSRRDETDELLASMPVTRGDRGIAHLLAVVAPTAGAVLMLGAAVLALTSWRGLPTPVAPSGGMSIGLDELTPAWAGLIQGPVLVGVAGVLGVALGRSPAQQAPVFVGAAVGLYVTLPAVLFWTWGWERFLLPAAHDLDAVTADVGGRSMLVVTGHVPAALGWHAVYLVGIAGTAASLVLSASTSRRRTASAALVGVALIASGVIGQLLVWTPAA